jgi:hypothetical protein
MRRQLVASGAAVTTALAVGLAVVALPAHAEHVDPIFKDGNPTCSDFAPEGETWLELKVDPVEGGTFTSEDGLLEVTITITESNDDDEPTTFDWTSNIGVDAVFAKAASEGNLYLYVPEATADTGLHAPDAGKGLSHISFCYDEGDTTSPPPTNGETTSPPPTNGETTSPPPTNGETKTPAPVPTEVPAGTKAGGSDLGLWGLIAVSSAAVAGAAVFARRRFLHDS